MIQFLVRNGTERLNKRLSALPQKIISAYLKGIETGLLSFKGFIVKTQMSGRESRYFGLFRRTGALARGWWVDARGGNSVKLFNIMAYGIYHQLGGKKIPKRLYVYEQFKTLGPGHINDGIKFQLRKIKV